MTTTMTVTAARAVRGRVVARVVAAAKRFTARTTLTAHGWTVNAGSVLMVCSAGIQRGEVVVVSADGSDAAEAVFAVAAVLTD